MKIIASICEVPGLNIPGNRAIFDPNIQNVKYSLGENIQLPHWAVSVCRKFFKENAVQPEEIGVIVGTSILVTGTTEDTNSAAPGVCHTIQRELGIKNAFVFDLFHSDWCTALEIADIFLSRQTHKYGLVVKAEKFNCLNNDLGFAWPDGLSIILFKNEENENVAVQHFYIEDKTISGAALNFLPNDDMNNKTVQFSINWDFNSNVTTLLANNMAQIVDNYKEKENGQMIIQERWFPQDKMERASHIPDTVNKDEVCLGMHCLPWSIQQLKSSPKEFLNQKVRMVSFNPFLLKYTSLTVNI
jgi:hypothetical protein